MTELNSTEALLKVIKELSDKCKTIEEFRECLKRIGGE